MDRATPQRRQSALASTIAAFLGVLVACLGGDARGEASDEQAAYLGAAVEVRELKAATDQRRGGVLGVELAFRYRVGRVPTDRALYLVAHLATVEGSKVRALGPGKAYRDRDGSFHGKQQLLTVPRNTWKRSKLFMPYHAMALGAGPHRLSLELSALGDTGSCKAGRPPRMVKVIGDTRAPLSLTKPPYKLAQLLVSAVSVVEEPTDVTIFRSRRSRPDLTWRVRIGTGTDEVVFTSDVRDNTYKGRWSSYTPEFPCSRGDAIVVDILDEDVMGHDQLGRLELGLDELLELGSDRGKTTRRAGKAEKIVFGELKVR